MKNKFKLLIIDDNVEFTGLLRQYLLTKTDIEVLESAKDGAEGLSKIREYKPDIVILDIIMPQMDGIAVLEKTTNMDRGTRPSFIVLSAFGHEKQIKRAMDLGADYYILKPFDVDILIKRIYDVFEERNNNRNKFADKLNSSETNKTEKIDSHIVSILNQLGIKANLSGYRFLKEAIRLSILDSNVFSSVTKILYPKTAENCKSSPQKVERAIRNAIDCAWKNNTYTLRNTLFGNTYSKPSNSQFISTVAEKIKTDLNIQNY